MTIKVEIKENDEVSIPLRVFAIKPNAPEPVKTFIGFQFPCGYLGGYRGGVLGVGDVEVSIPLRVFDCNRVNNYVVATSRVSIPLRVFEVYRELVASAKNDVSIPLRVFAATLSNGIEL